MLINSGLWPQHGCLCLSKAHLVCFLHEAHRGLLVLRNIRQYVSIMLWGHFKNHNKKQKNAEKVVPHRSLKGHLFRVQELKQDRSSPHLASTFQDVHAWGLKFFATQHISINCGNIVSITFGVTKFSL